MELSFLGSLLVSFTFQFKCRLLKSGLSVQPKPHHHPYSLDCVYHNLYDIYLCHLLVYWLYFPFLPTTLGSKFLKAENHAPLIVLPWILRKKIAYHIVNIQNLFLPPLMIVITFIKTRQWTSQLKMSDAQSNIEYVTQKKHVGWKYKLIIKEMQMITTMKRDLTLARLAIIKTKQWQQMSERMSRNYKHCTLLVGM